MERCSNCIEREEKMIFINPWGRAQYLDLLTRGVRICYNGGRNMREWKEIKIYRIGDSSTWDHTWALTEKEVGIFVLDSIMSHAPKSHIGFGWYNLDKKIFQKYLYSVGRVDEWAQKNAEWTANL